MLFEGLDRLVTPEARIGLVGSNGTGKSTLLKVLAGLETLEAGELTRAKGTTAGYYQDNCLSVAGRTVSDHPLPSFPISARWRRKWRRLLTATVRS